MSSEFGRTNFPDERLATLAALLNGDVTLAYRIATELLSQGVPFDDIVVDVLGPVQTEVGQRWADGDLSIADEHAASAAVEELVVRIGAIAQAPSGPTVVVAAAEHDAHALGARVVATSLALEGFRTLFIGASVPAEDLQDYLELHQPLALALSCSMSSALVGSARCIAAAHQIGIPVVGGGRAIASEQRARRLGIDALALVPHDAVDRLRAWEIASPQHLASVPAPVPEHQALADRSQRMIASVLEKVATGLAKPSDLGEELARVLQVIEATLLLDEPGLIGEHLRWLRDTGPAHGVPRPTVDAALIVLATTMDDDLHRASAALRAEMH
ncbi:MAG: cobalamin-dependent protein [Acidimicrobiales bacterium]